MNINRFNSFSKINPIRFGTFLATMVIVCMSVISTSSCSDDNGGGGNSIVGKYINSKYENGKKITASYSFYEDGTGMYDSGSEIWGDFTYSVSAGTGGGTVYMHITFVGYKNVWKGETQGSIDFKKKELRVDGKIFTKKE